MISSKRVISSMIREIKLIFYFIANILLHEVVALVPKGAPLHQI